MTDDAKDKTDDSSTPAPTPEPSAKLDAPKSKAPAEGKTVDTTAVPEKESAAERAKRIGWVRRELKNVSGQRMKWAQPRVRHEHGDVQTVVLPADQSVPHVMESLSCVPCNQDGSDLAERTKPTEAQAAAVKAEKE
jgi:hypothetical protein